VKSVELSTSKDSGCVPHGSCTGDREAGARELGQGTAADPIRAKYRYSRSANLKYQPAIEKLAQLGSTAKAASN
jgi:hypothetical protein